jgi:hypothetical protein
VANQCLVEEQLYKMQKHQRRKESVEMNIEGVAPFDVWIHGRLPHITIGHYPQNCCHNHSAEDAVNKNNVQQEKQTLPDSKT